MTAPTPLLMAAPTSPLMAAPAPGFASSLMVAEAPAPSLATTMPHLPTLPPAAPRPAAATAAGSPGSLTQIVQRGPVAPPTVVAAANHKTPKGHVGRNVLVVMLLAAVGTVVYIVALRSDPAADNQRADDATETSISTGAPTTTGV